MPEEKLSEKDAATMEEDRQEWEAEQKAKGEQVEETPPPFPTKRKPGRPPKNPEPEFNRYSAAIDQVERKAKQDAHSVALDALMEEEYEGAPLATWFARLAALWGHQQVEINKAQAQANRKTMEYRCNDCGRVVEALTPEERIFLQPEDPDRTVRCPNPEHPAGVTPVMNAVLPDE